MVASGSEPGSHKVVRLLRIKYKIATAATVKSRISHE